MTPQTLKGIREEMKLTQRELGQALGVTELTVWRWENGVRPIRPIVEMALYYLASQQISEWGD